MVQTRWVDLGFMAQGKKNRTKSPRKNYKDFKQVWMPLSGVLYTTIIKVYEKRINKKW